MTQPTRVRAVRPTHIAIVALAIVGTLLSAYLTWVRYSGSLALCVGVGGCEAVQTSRFAMAGPMPVAALGLVGFALILAASIAVARGAERWLVVLFGLSFAATLYVGYLSYVEVFVLEAICPWCVSVAVIAVLTFALVGREILAETA